MSHVGPMLVGKFSEARIAYPVDVQPKMDGLRCVAQWDGDSLALVSRGGNRYRIPHLEAEIASFLPRGMALDGELYLHGLDYQSVVCALAGSGIQFWAFDAVNDPDEPWSGRKARLAALRGSASCAPHIVWVQSVEARSAAEVWEIQRRHVAEGYEGAVVRDLSAPYVSGADGRIWKAKAFEDGEYRIVSSRPARGGDSRIWECTTPDGMRFRVAGQSEASSSGMLRVRHHGYYRSGIPRFAWAAGARDPRDAGRGPRRGRSIPDLRELLAGETLQPIEVKA